MKNIIQIIIYVNNIKINLNNNKINLNKLIINIYNVKFLIIL